MKNKLRFLLVVISLSFLAACGGSDSDSDNSAAAVNCVNAVGTSSGIELTNNCGYAVNVLVVDPTVRFSLADGEVKAVSRTGLVEFGACRSPDEPREGSGQFICV